MRLRTGLLALVLLLSLAGPATSAPTSAQPCAFPVTVTDASGTDVTVRETPSRVVTLSPSAAQTMWEIGAREKVVGVTKYAGYLEGAASRAQVSTTEQMVSFERVVDLRPDLVLAPNVVSTETVEKLQSANLTVYHFPPAETVEDVYAKTRRIGRLTGECEGAEETVSWMSDRIGVASEAAEGRQRPDVLYLFFGYTAGSGTFIDEIIEAAGGNNVAVDANVSGYRQLSQEVVLREDPDWIILNSENPPGLKPAVLNQTTAFQRNQTVVVPIEHLNQPAPRIVYAVIQLAKRFHPDGYAAANATLSPPTPTAAPPSATDGTPTAPTTRTTGQAGFGVLAAGICALVAAFVLRRR